MIKRIVKNFGDYINENLVNEKLDLLLESDVIYSDAFRNTISKIDSNISKSLLEIENKDLDVRSNYFNIDKKNDVVSFIPDRKAQEILNNVKELYTFVGRSGGWLTFNKGESGEYKNKSIFDALGFTPSEELIPVSYGEIGEIVKRHTSEKTDKTYAYVKFDNGNEMVINVDKLRKVESDVSKEVWSKNRQEVKVGRAIRALLKANGVDIVDKEIEEFVNKYKATIDKINDVFSFIEVVTGDDIGYWYNRDNYYRIGGQLGASCMSDVPKKYFNIYMENPDVCSLVILKSQDDDTKIVGRSLLWTLRNGKKFMDRIYTIFDSDIQLFKQWASDNDIYVKEHNNSSQSTYVISPGGEVIDMGSDMIVDIEGKDYEYYPYIDTLKQFSMGSGTLSAFSYGDYELESTNGRLNDCDVCNGDVTMECYECGGNGTEQCSECYGDGRHECSTCYGSDECSNCEGGGEIKCSVCDGDGCEDCSESGVEDCDHCNGSGSCQDCQDGYNECDNCGGDGDLDCWECGGSGEVECRECQ